LIYKKLEYGKCYFYGNKIPMTTYASLWGCILNRE